MRVRHPSANISPALIASLALSCNSPMIHGQVAPPASLFVVHGSARNCSSITQLDSALSSNYQGFFAGWSEQDYRDAIAWSQACADFGWHVPGRPRIPLLQAQHDQALGIVSARVDTSAVNASHYTPADLSGEPAAVRAPLKLPADGSPVIGSDTTICPTTMTRSSILPAATVSVTRKSCAPTPASTFGCPGRERAFFYPSAASCRPAHARALS